MKFVFFLLVLLISQISYSSILKVKKGTWQAQLKLNSTYNLPIRLSIKSDKITIKNAEERIELLVKINTEGQIYIPFKYYNSKLVIEKFNKKFISGYWHNMSKGKDYMVPFTSVYSKNNIVPNPYLDRFSGKWEVITTSHSKLIGEFKNNGQKLFGTFLTETGDYRYLEGSATKDSMYLSCFDGSHAFLFTAKLKNDSLYGEFLSGKHFKTSWIAFKNDKASLKNPEKLTYTINDSKVSFSLKNTLNSTVKYPNENNKFTIIQILGTWCPNCIDETKYLTEIYPNYKSKIDFIGIAFEKKSSTNEQIVKLKHFKSMMNIEYDLLLGGDANKKEPLILFPMLNKIIAFPTLLILDKDNNIIKTHAGFNGPGTGKHYIDYKIKMKIYLDSLILN